MAQVERKSFTYIGWQGQLSPAPTFRSDGNPCLPVDVFQVQCDDFASTQAQSGQQKQNRIISVFRWESVGHCNPALFVRCRREGDSGKVANDQRATVGTQTARSIVTFPWCRK